MESLGNCACGWKTHFRNMQAWRGFELERVAPARASPPARVGLVGACQHNSSIKKNPTKQLSLVEPLMTDASMPLLDATQLQRLAHTPPSQCQCTLRACLGWESVSDDRWPAAHMRGAGTLRQPLP